MNTIELIERLTTLVKLQADIIEAQAAALAQVGAIVMEEEQTNVGLALTALIERGEVPEGAELGR